MDPPTRLQPINDNVKGHMILILTSRRFGQQKFIETWQSMQPWQYLNTFKPELNDRHFVDDIFTHVFFIE